jgi:hypothetical protein
MTRNLPLGLLLGIALPIAATAQDASVGAAQAFPEKPGAREMKVVESLLTRYLEAVKSKHWSAATQLIHPKTVAVIAERKKRLGREDHPMAPWYYEKGLYYLKAYRIAAAHYVSGAFAVDVLEDNYQLPERVLAEGEPAAYLVGKFRGKWYVVDKKRGETFSDSSVKVGYAGYFDKLQFPREEEEED